MLFTKKTVSAGSYKFKQPSWGTMTVLVTILEGKNGLEVVFAKGHPGILLKDINSNSIFESFDEEKN